MTMGIKMHYTYVFLFKLHISFYYIFQQHFNKQVLQTLYSSLE